MQEAEALKEIIRYSKELHELTKEKGSLDDPNKKDLINSIWQKLQKLVNSISFPEM